MKNSSDNRHTYQPWKVTGLWLGLLCSTLFVVAIIGPVGDDDMVEEMDAHQVAGLLDAGSDGVVVTAGMQTA